MTTLVDNSAASAGFDDEAASAGFDFLSRMPEMLSGLCIESLFIIHGNSAAYIRLNITKYIARITSNHMLLQKKKRKKVHHQHFFTASV